MSDNSEYKGSNKELGDLFSSIKKAARNVEYSPARKIDLSIRNDAYGQLALPFMSDLSRAVPNIFLRCAIFGALGAMSKRTYYELRKMASVAGYEVFYTGSALCQKDFSVWQNIIYLCQGEEVGKPVQFTAYEMLMLLGMKDTGTNRKNLHTRLSRLSASSVEIKTKDGLYSGSLIQEFVRDEKTKLYTVSLNPNLMQFFGPDTYTSIGWDIRQALEKKELAQFLHGFYSSHAKPYEYKITTLLEIANTKNPFARGSKQKLLRALNDYAEISTRMGEKVSFSVIDERINLQRQPSPSQGLHLVKRMVEKRRQRARERLKP